MHIRIRAPLVLCCLLPLLTTGCAAMFTGTTDEVTFLSDKEGSKVRVNGVEYPTPHTGKFPKSTTEAVFIHPDYGELNVPIKRSFQGGMLVMDILFTPGFGLTGILVDSMTSAYYDLVATVNANFAAAILARAAESAKATEAARSAVIGTPSRTKRRVRFDRPMKPPDVRASQVTGFPEGRRGARSRRSWSG